MIQAQPTVFAHLKTESITAVLTSLTPHHTAIERTEVTISRLMDTWIVLGNATWPGPLGVVCTCSSPVASREFDITDHGLDLRPADEQTPLQLGIRFHPREKIDGHAAF